MKIFPCINSTQNNNHCKPLEVIDSYLNDTFISFYMQDVELTPTIYKQSVHVRDKEVNIKLSRHLFKNIRAFFQIINVETDQDLIGFDIFENNKKEKFIRFESTTVFNYLHEKSIYESGDQICDITLQLADQVLTHKRTYNKLIQIFDDIGGLMEIIFSFFFDVIASFISEALYDKILVNNLFEFYKNITYEEKKIIEENVINEFKERENIIEKDNRKNNSTNKINNILDKINENIKKRKTKSVNKEEDKNFFTQDFCIPDITEDNLDMKYYFKINASKKLDLPNLLMNHLVNKLYDLKSKDNDILFCITPSEKAFKIYIEFEDDKDINMIEELIKGGFNDYTEYKNAFHCQNLGIRIKLFITNDGYLIKVKKEVLKNLMNI